MQSASLSIHLGDGDEEKFHIPVFQEILRRDRKCIPAYANVCVYIILLLLYSYLLSHRIEHAPEAVKQSEAWREAILVGRPAIFIYDRESSWDFVENTLLPLLYTGGTKSKGARDGSARAAPALERSYIIGGIAVTAARLHVSPACYPNIPCFNNQRGFLTEGTERVGNATVWYSSAFDGFTAFLPAQLPPENPDAGVQLLHTLRDNDFFGDDTKILSVSFLSYNPNGAKLISRVHFSIICDLFGRFWTKLAIDTTPEKLYPTGSWWRLMWRISVEVLFLTILSSYVYYYIQAYNSYLPTGHVKDKGARRRLPSMPDGRTVLASGVLWCGFMILQIALYLWLMWKWLRLPPLDNPEQNLMLQRPKACDGPTVTPSCHEQLSENLHATLDPLWADMKNAIFWFTLYIRFAGFVIVFLVVDIFNFLAFHPRLSRVSDVVFDVKHDLAHLVVNLGILVFGFTGIMQIGFGSQVPAYSLYRFGFYDNVMRCFQLFRPMSAVMGDSPLTRPVPMTNVEDGMVPQATLFVHFLFQIIVVMIVFKFSIAIILQANRKLQQQEGNTSRLDVVTEACEVMIQPCWDWLQSFCGRPYITGKELGTKLRANFRRKDGTYPEEVIDRRKLEAILDCNEEVAEFAIKRYGRQQAANVVPVDKDKVDQLLDQVQAMLEVHQSGIEELEQKYTRLEHPIIDGIDNADVFDLVGSLGYPVGEIPHHVWREVMKNANTNKDTIMEWHELLNLLKEVDAAIRHL